MMFFHLTHLRLTGDVLDCGLSACKWGNSHLTHLFLALNLAWLTRNFRFSVTTAGIARVPTIPQVALRALPARRHRHVEGLSNPLPETPLSTWLRCTDACVPHPTWTRRARPAPDDNIPEMPERRRKRKCRGGGGRGKRRSRFSLPPNPSNRRRAGVGEAAAGDRRAGGGLQGRGRAWRAAGGRVGAPGLPTAWLSVSGPFPACSSRESRGWVCGSWPSRP